MLALSLLFISSVCLVIAWAFNLSSKLKQIDRELRKLTSRISQVEGRVRAPEGRAPEPSPAQPLTPSTPSIAVPLRPEHQPGVTVPPEHPPQQLFPEPIVPSKSRAEWESLIGGKLLNRIGALALIIGVGFFLKYAFDNNWITETARVAIGGMIGVLLLGVAARSRKHGYSIFAQGLVGAGIAVLYLSVFASFNFYQLVSQPVAFVLMACVTVVAFTQAFQYDSLAVSLLGWLGGFLTPFLLSTGVSNEAGLFSYIALLDIGLMAIVFRKEAWFVLEPLAAGATYSVYLAWYLKFYSSADFTLTLVFLVLFWFIFFAVDTYRDSRGINSYNDIRRIVTGGNALLFYGNLYALVNPDHHAWTGAITLSLGGLYLIAALLVKKSDRGNDPAFRESLLFAIALLAGATTIQYTGFTTVMCWSGEALLLTWIGVRMHLKLAWISSLAILAIAICQLFATDGSLSYTPLEHFAPILNRRFMAYIVLAASAAGGAIAIGRTTERRRSLVTGGLHYTWGGLTFMVVTLETIDFFRVRLTDMSGDAESHMMFTLFMVLAAVWSLFSLPFLWSSFRRDLLPMLVIGLIALLCAFGMSAIRGLTYDPISYFTFLWNVRMLCVLIVLGCGVLVQRWMRVEQHVTRIPEDIPTVLRVGIVLLLLFLLTGETRDLFERKIWVAEIAMRGQSDAQSLNTLENLKQLFLSGVWLFYSILLMGFGIWRRTRAYRIIAIVLFGITILKIFIYDLSFLDTLYRIFSFIGLGVILLAVSYLYQRYKSVIFEEGGSKNEQSPA